MIRFEQLKTKPALMKCLTGLTVEGFRALLASFEIAYQAALDRREAERGTPRQRQGVPTRKVQGVTKDESNALVRLADALAGFVVDALKGDSEAIKSLYSQALRRGELVEV
jgi:hypothetical protein